jgi:RNase P/RNase MRP subunit POP5
MAVASVSDPDWRKVRAGEFAEAISATKKTTSSAARIALMIMRAVLDGAVRMVPRGLNGFDEE